MTVVGFNPVVPDSSLMRRTLLPRNPTPWSSPEIPTLPPAVQRLLQQIGGSSYQTYQPFQVVQPLITPQPPVSFTDCAESSTSSERSVSSTPQDLDSNQSSYTGHSQVNFPFSTSASNHSAANSTLAASNSVQSTRLSPVPLTHLCRNRLLSYFGLRKLRRILLSMKAPKCVAKFLSTVSAKECVVRSSAPLLDVFAQPFFHRAVTWRVECCLDGQPYLATYAHTDTSALVQCEWMSEDADEEQDECSSAWLYCNHPHIMRVWGVVVDPHTGNNFYLLDTPIATLDQILTRLHEHGGRLPEPLVWRLVGSVSSALLHASRSALPYEPLLLSNVFLLSSAVVIENALTKKKQFTGCSCSRSSSSSSSKGCCAEACFVQNIGRIIYALCTCGIRSLHEHVDGTHVHYGAVTRALHRQYSDTLLTLLARTLGGGPQGLRPPVPSPQWRGNHNGRRVFADINKAKSSARVTRTDHNSDFPEAFERNPCDGNFSPLENKFYSSSLVASRPLSSSSLSPNVCATPVASSSQFSSASASCHSSFSSSSDYANPDVGAFLPLVFDNCLGITNATQISDESSPSRELSGFGGTNRSQSTVPHSLTVSHTMEAFTTQSYSQHHVTIVNCANASRKLDRRQLSREASTQPESHLTHQKTPHEKRRKRSHQRKRHLATCSTSKENISPVGCQNEQHVGISDTLMGDKFISSNVRRISAKEDENMFPPSFVGHSHTNAQGDNGRVDLSLSFNEISKNHIAPHRNGSCRLNSKLVSAIAPSSSTDFSSISLEEIVAIAEAEVRKSCGDGCTLEEALRRSPRDLVELAMSYSS